MYHSCLCEAVRLLPWSLTNVAVIGMGKLAAA